MADKRPIFEEVPEGKQAPRAAPSGGLISDESAAPRSFARLWLAVLFGLVVAMIVVGGLTRLNDAGLSITEWRPVTGALPPLSQDEWQSEFAKYQDIPEFALQNSAMTLEDFKSIYWWEWGHRQLGRIIGLVWAVGFFGLLAARRMPRGWAGRFLGLGALGGLQGAIGWWMVASGLSGRMVDVASYRLAIHLGLAFAILGLIVWYFLTLARGEGALMQARRAGAPRLFSAATGLMHLAFAQVLLGALVAGIDAGSGFSDWPLMAGGFFPPGPFDLRPLWVNFFENAGTVQFMHRLTGYAVLIVALVVWRRSRQSGNRTIRRAFDGVMVMTAGQVVLGIGTVIFAAPLGWAIVHQLGAVALWSLILRARFYARYPASQSLRS